MAGCSGGATGRDALTNWSSRRSSRSIICAVLSDSLRVRRGA
jgi:hypothetical protein